MTVSKRHRMDSTSLIGIAIGRFVIPFYLAVAWFVFRAFSILVFEGWFATIKGIKLPGVARRLVSIAHSRRRLGLH